MHGCDVKIVLKSDRAAVSVGGTVNAWVEVTPKDALKTPGVSVTWEACEGGPGGKSIAAPAANASDNSKATWKAPAPSGGATVADVTLAAEFHGADGTVLDVSTKTMTVLRNPTLTIRTPVSGPVPEGTPFDLEVQPSLTAADLKTHQISIQWDTGGFGAITTSAKNPLKAAFETPELKPGTYLLAARLVDRDGVPLVNRSGAPVEAETEARVAYRNLSRGDTLAVQLRRSGVPSTPDQALWVAIRNRTKAIAFSGSGYKDFIDRVLCKRESLPEDAAGKALLERELSELGTSIYGGGAYELLKVATQVFLLLECGVVIKATGAFDTDALYSPDEETSRLGQRVTLGEISDRLTDYLGSSGRLPYIDRILKIAFPDESTTDSVFCYGVLGSKVQSPCMLELIWSYWHEEGMLVQTLNAISRRFQNVRGIGDRDPLAHLEIDPLRPLNNILWGYIQDEQNRLTLKRRAYEYDHHYGLTIYGKAVPTLRPADSRSKFLEGFHNLLHLCSVFYKEDNDTTVIADGFPLLNALKEVHLLLAQGAHNQFGDLPWTARAEMLIQQWLVARPEIRDFLQSRPMVPYKEAWMPQVDTMKTLQGWSDVTVTHFRDLGAYGEQILLSIRYGDWIDVNDEESAKNWARYWRPEVQGYLHAYRAVTGVDLTNPDTVDYTMPAVHLQKRLANQRSR